MRISLPRPGPLLLLAALAAAGTPSLASASDIGWSVTVGSSRPAPIYAPPPVIYVHPEPVYVVPRPVYVQPQTVYVQPAPVIVGAPLRAYEPRQGRGKDRHWKERRERHYHHHHYYYDH